MRWTKGRHAFIVTTHTDKKHIHCHIYYNSTTLDCTRKFHNFWGSSFALRRLSDRLCLENGLSIVENPKPRSKGNYKNYGEWLQNRRGRLTFRINCGWQSTRHWQNAPAIWRPSSPSWSRLVMKSRRLGAAACLSGWSDRGRNGLPACGPPHWGRVRLKRYTGRHRREPETPRPKSPQGQSAGGYSGEAGRGKRAGI